MRIYVDKNKMKLNSVICNKCKKQIKSGERNHKGRLFLRRRTVWLFQ